MASVSGIFQAKVFKHFWVVPFSSKKNEKEDAGRDTLLSSTPKTIRDILNQHLTLFEGGEASSSSSLLALQVLKGP